MVAGGAVGGGRAVGEGVGRAVAVGRVEVGEVVVDEGVVAAVDVPVEAREEEVLLLEAGRRRSADGDVTDVQEKVDAGGTLRRGDGGRALRRGDGGRAGGGARGRQRDDVGVGVEDAADLAEAIVGEEVEEPVLDDGAADGAAELLLLVDGLGEQEGVSVVVERLVLVVGIERVEVGIAEVVEGVAVDGVGAGLGDGVDLTAGGLAELDGVVGGCGLELLDGVDGVDVGGTGGAAAGLGEEHLIVVGAVDVVLVVEAADAVEADEAGAAVGGDVGRVAGRRRSSCGRRPEGWRSGTGRWSGRPQSSRCRGAGIRW